MIKNLQFLRAFAAFMVFYVHIQQYIIKVYPGFPLMSFGNAGVDIFFVISGFVMVASTSEKETSSIDFYINRIARVVPLYWLITSFVVIAFWAGFHPIGVDAVTAEYVLRSMLFLPISRGGFEYPLLFVGWTLAYEMFFYLIFGAALQIRSQRSRLAMVTVFLSCLVATRFFVESGPLFFKFYTNPIMLDFLFGMWLAYVHSTQKWAPKRITAWALLLVAALGLIVLPDLHGVGGYSGDFARPATWGLAGVALVVVLVGMETRDVVVRSKVLMMLGAASYSIYLCHTIVLHMIEKISGSLEKYPMAFVTIMVLGGITLTCLVSVVLLKSFELPANRYLRKMLTDLVCDRRKRVAGRASNARIS